MYRKICTIILMLIFFFQNGVSAFESSLTDAIKNDEELFFAYIAEFEQGEYLITASKIDNAVVIKAFDESDGKAMTDAFKVKGEKEISVVADSGKEYILVKSNDEEKIYMIEDDEFKRCKLEDYDIVIRIAQVGKNAVNTYSNKKGAVYNLLNDIKLKKMKNYSFIDRRNSMSDESLGALRNIIVAAADIMSFDSKSCDVDRLMKYVINTYENFRGIVPYEAGNYSNNDEIKQVNTEYIDYIVSEIFGQKPVRPPANELIDRGYCYNGSNYAYTDAFETEFSTEVRNIAAVYDVGNDVYFVIFGDIYTEKGKSIPEYSYIIFKQENDGYKILRLGMGELLLDENEVMSYAGTDEVKKYVWESVNTEETDNVAAAWWGIAAIGVLVAVLLVFYKKL